MIVRKPVPARVNSTPVKVEAAEKEELGESDPKDLSLNTNAIDSPTTLPEEPEEPEEPASPQPPIVPLASHQQPATWPASTAESKAKVGTALKTAYAEARHFAGGLLAHPAVSTAHHSVLRHSTGIVAYKGAHTNLAISVFADAPLPPDRSLWLQRKGWTGRLGMKVGALGARAAWIDVTPDHAVAAADLPPADDRAWMRDVRHFVKRAGGKARHHVLRETCVLRIPCEADDGYLRVVLCAGPGGKKILCPSPVFRLVSASASPASIKGAKLSTLPLELGLKVGGWVAKAHASDAVQNLAGSIGSALSQYQPGFLEREALEAGYDVTAAGKVNQMEQNYQQKRDEAYDMATYDDDFADTTAAAELENLTPKPPFPIDFKATLQSKATQIINGENQVDYCLTGVPDITLHRHIGRFCGWIKFTNEKLKQNEWYPVLVNFRLERHKVSHVKAVKLIPLGEESLDSMIQTGNVKDGSKVEVLLLAFLSSNASDSAVSSPLSPTTSKGLPSPTLSDTTTETEDQDADIEIAQSLLVLPTFAPDPLMQQLQATKSEKKLAEKLSDMRMAGQRKYDSIPAHRLGIRTNGQKIRDQLVGKGGLYVVR